MIEQFDRYFRGRKPWQIHIFCVGFILLLGWFDYATGFEASSSVFYLLPVSLSAWYLQGNACYFYSIFAAMVWDSANFLAGESYSHPAFFVWNGIVRAIFFVTTATLLQRLRGLLTRERKMSRIDHLTGLSNTRAFHEALNNEHARSIRSEQSLGVAVLDLDKFKKVNDQMGHAEGDRVLVSVAKTLKSQLRRTDTIARIGGDEFAVLLPHCGLDDARNVAEKLLSSLRELSQERAWPVGVSIGVVVLEHPSLSDKLDELLKHSDRLMYRVKEQGRNNFLVELHCPHEI